jgi:hypothetical protein
MTVACPSSRPVARPPKPEPSGSAATPAPIVLHEPAALATLRKSPELLDRLVASPYGYFRFVNLRFADEVCKRFANAKASMPLVNLHGDAHLEQYAVTSLGRGLADYDDASTGPAVIDLVRFSVSLVLAARERHWNAGPATKAFMAGYVAALEDPEAKRPVPDYVTRIEKTFTGDRLQFLDRTEKLMHELPEEDAQLFEQDYARYVGLMRKLHPEVADGFFTLKKYGRLRSGIGSALSKKYLMRVEGESSAPEDDVVLEAKELRDLGAVGCMTASVGGGAFRILLGQTRIGGQPMRFLAQIPRAPGQSLSEQPFWVQAWLDNYRELTIDDPGLTEKDLLQISRDVGVQLGRGHVTKIADPLGPQLRAAQLRMLDDLGPQVDEAIQEMTSVTLQSWKRFIDRAQK